MGRPECSVATQLVGCSSQVTWVQLGLAPQGMLNPLCWSPCAAQHPPPPMMAVRGSSGKAEVKVTCSLLGACSWGVAPGRGCAWQLASARMQRCREVLKACSLPAMRSIPTIAWRRPSAPCHSWSDPCRLPSRRPCRHRVHRHSSRHYGMQCRQ